MTKPEQDPSGYILSTDEDTYGDILPVADLGLDTHDESESRDYDLEIHQDAIDTLEEIKRHTGPAVELGAVAHQLADIIDKLAHINMLKGFLEGGKPADPKAVQDKKASLVHEVNSEIYHASGLDNLVESGEMTELDAQDMLNQIRHGLRERYVGPSNAKARDLFIKYLRTL